MYVFLLILSYWVSLRYIHTYKNMIRANSGTLAAQQASQPSSNSSHYRVSDPKQVLTSSLI